MELFYGKKIMKLINLFGGPNSGKTTLAAGLFYCMKKRGLDCECVREFVQGLIYDGANEKLLDCQPYIYGNQLKDVFRFRDTHDYVVTDSPILLSCVYGRETQFKWSEEFFRDAMETHSSFDNINVYVNRPPTYNKVGRIHTSSEAKEIDKKIKGLLLDHEIPFYTVEYNDDPERILDQIGVL